MRIGLDIDGVLANFDTHLLNYLDYKDKTPPKIYDDPRIMEGLPKVEKNIMFWLTMPPLIEGKKLDFNPVIYVTKRPIYTHITKQWLNRHEFPDAPIVTVGMKGDKTPHLIDKVDFYIEDSYDNYMELNKNGINCFLLTTRYNKQHKVSKRINSINEILNYV